MVRITARYNNISEPAIIVKEGEEIVLKNTTYIQDGSLASLATYIVFKKNSVYYVRNGLTGKIEYNDTDVSTVINWVLSQLNNGGKVLLNLIGEHTITSTIQIEYDNIVIQGLGTSTYLKLANNVNDTLFKVTGNNVTIRNMYLDGNKNNQSSGYIIELNGSLFSSILYCYIKYGYYDGIYITGNGVTKIIGNRIQGNGRHGIRFASGSDDSFVFYNDIGSNDSYGISVATVGRIKIVGNNIYSNTIGVDLYTSLRCQVIANYLHSSSINIRIYGSSADWGRENVIMSNEITNGNGVRLSGYANRNVIAQNVIHDVSDGIKELDNADYNLILGNILRSYTTGITTIGTNTVSEHNIT